MAIVPEAGKMLNALKYEIAAELGLSVANHAAGSYADAEFSSELGMPTGGVDRGEPYWGHLSSRDAGAVGGQMTRHLIRLAQQSATDL